MTHEFLSLKELKCNSYKKEVSKQTEGHSSFASGVIVKRQPKMTREAPQENEIVNIQVNSTNDVTKNNKDEKYNLLSNYDKYKSIFDITVSNGTVTLIPLNQR